MSKIHFQLLLLMQFTLWFFMLGGSRYVPGSLQNAVSGPGYDPFTGMLLL